MAMSMRARLTAWYCALLFVALGAFCGVILSVHWHTLVRQYDEGLDAMAGAAATTMHNEFAEEGSAASAATEAEDVLRSPGIVVHVLNADGRPVDRRAGPPPFPAGAKSREGHVTMAGQDGHLWRVAVRAAPAGSSTFFIEVAGSLDPVVQQWRSLLRACLIGLPLILVCAGTGGWWLARRGLRPLETMASEAQAITAESADRRLSRPAGAMELEPVAGAFNLVLQRLASALDNQRRFMADASHELRTPLSTIRTAADVTLNQPTRTEDEYRDALGTVAQQSARLGRLVDDMFLLARADAGGYPVQLEPVDLARVVTDCAAELSPLARDRGVTVAVAVPDDAPVMGDEALLRRLVLNLAQNAIAYSRESGRVELSLSNGGVDVVLRVADSGPGIPESERTRIFERFVRLDPARHRNGAGLGLSIARWIADLHGGGLDLASSDSSGSVFVARFRSPQGIT